MEMLVIYQQIITYVYYVQELTLLLVLIMLKQLCLKAAFAVVPTEKFVGGAYHKKNPLI